MLQKLVIGDTITEKWISDLVDSVNTGSSSWIVSTEDLQADAAAPESSSPNDIVLDSNFDVFTVTAENKLSLLGNIKGTDGKAGKDGAGLTGTASTVSALAEDADIATCVTKVNEVIAQLKSRGITK